MSNTQYVTSLANLRKRTAEVTVPGAGTVVLSALSAGDLAAIFQRFPLISRLVQGSRLQPDDIAMVLVTDTSQPLRAALRISSRRRGFVREGQTVRLKFDAFPYAKFGSYEARIDSISRTTVSAAQPMSADVGEDGMPQSPGDDYIAWVTLRGHTFEYGKEHFDILPGMQASASIVVERRTIAEWVLEPLFKIVRG